MKKGACLLIAIVGSLSQSNVGAFAPGTRSTASSVTNGAKIWGVSTKNGQPSVEDTTTNIAFQQTGQLDTAAYCATVLRAAASDGNAAAPLGIIIAGAPASGKGTQCEMIQKDFGVVHLSTGDMLRAAVAAGTDVGKAAKDFMDAGKLVPDEVIIGVVS
jgi:adenylate kinase